jgi:predicted permease
MLIALKFAVRQLLKTSGFTATALATLAICLAANLTIFAIVDAILLRPLPFPDSERLVEVFNSYPGAGVDRASSSLPNYFDRRHAIKAFSSLSIVQDSSTIVGGAEAPTRVTMARVSPEFFSTLGVPLAMGSTFTDPQMVYGADQVAILTDEYWRNHFDSDPKVIGRTFLNDGLSVSVIGVLPRGFRFLSSKAQFFRPAGHDADDIKATNRHSNNWEMVARLAPGATLVEAQQQINAFNLQQIADDPYAQIVKGAGYHTTVSSLHQDHVRSVKPMLVLLQCGVLFLLLIGGVNLANLLLIRASSRSKELAVRQALGAGRRHVIMDVLMETTLLGVGGGVCGLLLGAFGIDMIRSLGTDQLPLGATVAYDSRVAAAAFAAAVVSSLILAAPVVWFNLRTKLATGLQAESRSGTVGRGAQRLRHGFIVAQVALAFVLLSGAGLLSVSLKRVLSTPAGFNPDNVLAGNISLPWKDYKDDTAILGFINRLLPVVRALPGVEMVAIDTGLPFAGSTNDSAVTVEGFVPHPGESIRAHYMSQVMGDFFPLMGIPLLKGRLLRDSDNNSKSSVCVVDQAFANRYWPNVDPIGRRLTTGPTFDKDKVDTVVGVVASIKQNELAEDAGHGAMYCPIPSPNMGFRSFALVIRTPLPPMAIIPTVRKAVLQIDPGIPVDDFRTLRSRIDDSLVARRSPAVLAGVFAMVALLLAAIGTYGVLSYAVAQRQREIGVRMALGAHPSQIRGQFLLIGVRLLVVGTAVGIVGAWLAGRAMQSILFNVPPFHAASLLATVAVMSVVALAACLLPANRATRVDPVVALRGD